MLKAVSDKKTYICLYTDWSRQGLTYYNNITVKFNTITECSAQFSLGFFTYHFLRFFGKPGVLTEMINTNIQKTLQRARLAELERRRALTES